MSENPPPPVPIPGTITNGMRVQASSLCAMNRYLTHPMWEHLPECDKIGLYHLIIEDQGRVLLFCEPHFAEVTGRLDKEPDDRSEQPAPLHRQESPGDR